MASFQGTGINPTRFHRSQLKFYAFLIPVAIFMGLPILYIFFTAFKPIDEMFLYPPRFITTRPTLENFIKLFSNSTTTNIPVSRYMFNSLISTFGTMIVTILISSSAGFILSKKKFKFKKQILAINNLALMFVTAAVAIPRYLIIVKLGLIDNFWVHILPALIAPVNVFLVKQFIDQIPDELVEAARIDGANDYHILLKIIMPLIKPAIATIAIMSFQGAWNSAEASTMYLNNESLKNFAFYMSTISSVGGVAGQGLAAASALIMFVPNLVIFIFAQSKVMNTMAHSGMK